MKFRRKSVVEGEEIPTGSMGDIAFLLIVFFMLTTVFSKESGIKMELPETVTQEELNLKSVIISIKKNGEIHVDGVVKSLVDIAPYVVAAISEDPTKFVTIKSDKNARYGVIMDVMDELMQVGIKDIALPTEPEEVKK